MNLDPTPPNKWIQIDWLSINVRHPENKIVCPNHDYSVKLLDITTRHFKVIEEIYQNGERIATVTRTPASKIINPFTIIIKFDNAWLYKPMLHPRLLHFIKAFNLTFHNMSRLDLSHDFVKFDNGLMPQNLIYRFLTDYYILLGKRAWQSNGQQQTKQDFQYLRFGSKTSNLNFYLYNKSLEQNKIVFKPWIIQLWESLNIDTSQDVWRLEFSIKNGNSETVDNEGGEIRLLNTLAATEQNFIHDLYFTLVNKYFHFKKNDGQKNVSRMESIKLFKSSINSDYFKFFHLSTETKRSDKIFIRRLEKTYNELREEKSEAADYAYELIKHEINKRGLQEWASRNITAA